MKYAERAQVVLRHVKLGQNAVYVSMEAPIYVERTVQTIVEMVEDRWALDVAFEVIKAATELAPQDGEDSPAVNQMTSRLAEPRFTSLGEAAWWVINRRTRSLRQSVADVLAVTDAHSDVEVLRFAEEEERVMIIERVLALLNPTTEQKTQEIRFDH